MPRQPEAQLWQEFKRAFQRERLEAREQGYVERIESTVGLGVPDVHCVVHGEEAWVELKVLRGWPKRDATKVNLAHFTPVQQRWAARHTAAGGTWYMLLKVLDDGAGLAEYLLLDCPTALRLAARQLTTEEVRGRALHRGASLVEVGDAL